MESDRLPATQSVWVDELYQRWWARMGEIFGRDWHEKFGAKPSESWCQELQTWSLDLAAAVLVHYRRSGSKFAPNLSEVGRLARELHAALEPKPAPRRHDPNAVSHAFALQCKHDLSWIKKYRGEHPGISNAEACVVLLRKRKMLHGLPDSVHAEAEKLERALEAETLQSEATKEAAKKLDTENALEALAERTAIVAESSMGD